MVSPVYKVGCWCVTVTCRIIFYATTIHLVAAVMIAHMHKWAIC